ncbi:golgi uridine diphosphate-N- acetylglucosamine transporter [Dispira simplex]|nr:golgi uridine diphosphate-N- acetylglucosamine transporter [Dispira simplex]
MACDGLVRHLEWNPSDWDSQHPPRKPFAIGFWPRLRLKSRVVPLRKWFVMVVLYFTVSVLNNWALAFHISVPLHIVFRSGGLVMNMVVGYLFMRKQYSSGQVLSVALVTMGVILATLGSSETSTSTGQAQSDHSPEKYTEWLTGIGILSVAMILIAFLGLYQELTYRQYRNAWREGMFYNHLLALPFFLPMWPTIWDQIQHLNASTPLRMDAFLPAEPASLGWLSSYLVIPSLWLYLALNVGTQYVCATGVNYLTAITSSLTVNLVLNIRKLVSLVLSVIIFNNPLTFQSKVGCALVFFGSLLYSRSTEKKFKLESKEN